MIGYPISWSRSQGETSALRCSSRHHPASNGGTQRLTERLAAVGSGRSDGTRDFKSTGRIEVLAGRYAQGSDTADAQALVKDIITKRRWPSARQKAGICDRAAAGRRTNLSNRGGPCRSPTQATRGGISRRRDASDLPDAGAINIAHPGLLQLLTTITKPRGPRGSTFPRGSQYPSRRAAPEGNAAVTRSSSKRGGRWPGCRRSGGKDLQSVLPNQAQGSGPVRDRPQNRRRTRRPERMTRQMAAHAFRVTLPVDHTQQPEAGRQANRDRGKSWLGFS